MSALGQIQSRTKTPNSPSGPPPQQALPQITYVQQAWIDAGYTINNYASCATAKTAITNGLVGNNVVRISPTCALSWGNNSTITVKGNLAIITDWGFNLAQKSNWNGASATEISSVCILR